MKKQSKNMLIVLFLALTMFGSSFAFVILGNPTNAVEETGGPVVPKEYVVTGALNESLRNAYLRQGYTIGTFRYVPGCCEMTLAILDGLPAELEYQLVVEKIESNETKFEAVSLRADSSTNQTNSTAILRTLCDVLMMPPPDCGLMMQR